MKFIYALIASFMLMTVTAEARLGHGGTGPAQSVPNCPQGITLASFDGCLGAQLAGSSGVSSTILNTYNNNTPFLTPPPFNVPARDYPVGYDTTLVLTPAVSWVPAANMSCSKNTTLHRWTCTTHTATCSPCTIAGIDFSDWEILFNGTGGTSWIIRNNKFKNGPTVSKNNEIMVSVASGTSINVDYSYNECDGDASHYAYSSCLGNVTGGTSPANLKTYNVTYNYFHDIPVRPLQINGTNADVNVNWNYAKSFTQDEWTAQNVVIDNVLNTMTVTGPFVTTGANLIHGFDQNGSQGAQGFPCQTFTGIPSTDANFTGGVTAQVSGTPGGFGVYTFTTATGAYGPGLFQCGNGLHGEINASGIANGGIQHSMTYRGNFITYGSDCPANGTANIAFLVAPNIYTAITTAFADYNTLVNGVSGNGKGCASQAIRNNGVIYYGSATVANNYIAPFNAGAYQGNSSTSCFGWPGGLDQGFSGTQTTNDLNVTSVTAGKPLPIGGQVTQGVSLFGYVLDNSLANANGSGHYTMSDSRSQTFTGGKLFAAPNQANAGGSIPYAPFFTGNKNMILSGSAANFVISDAQLTTSAGCHI